MSDLVFACSCYVARMLPREVQLVSERIGLPWQRVKCFEGSNGLDTALYKKHNLFRLDVNYCLFYIG